MLAVLACAVLLPFASAQKEEWDVLCAKLGPTERETKELELLASECAKATLAEADVSCSTQELDTAKVVCGAVRQVEAFFCSAKRIVQVFIDMRRKVVGKCLDLSRSQECLTAGVPRDCIQTGLAETYHSGLVEMEKDVRIFRSKKLTTQVILHKEKAEIMAATEELATSSELTALAHTAIPVLKGVFEKIGEPPVEGERQDADVGTLEKLERQLHGTLEHMERTNIGRAKTDVDLMQIKKSEQRDDAAGGITITKERLRRFSEALPPRAGQTGQPRVLERQETSGQIREAAKTKEESEARVATKSEGPKGGDEDGANHHPHHHKKKEHHKGEEAKAAPGMLIVN